MLMHSDVKAVAESANAGMSFLGTIRKSLTTFLNHGSVEVKVLSHRPVAVLASFSRL